MSPTAFKVAQLDEEKRANLANEANTKRGQTLNFVSNLVGSGLSAVSGPYGRIASAMISKGGKK